ncbi:MAG: hypothetical protein IH620_06635 [Ignavibacterium sp.]|nr:hypothetical protein [Ignavibacterium sp.]
MKVEDIIDERWEFKLSEKSNEDDVGLSIVRIDDEIMHRDTTLIKSSVV